MSDSGTKTVTRTSKGLCLSAALFAAAMFLSATTAFAQDDLRELVYGNPTKSTPRKDQKKKTKTSPQKPAPAPATKAAAPITKPAPRNVIDVTFLAREPMLEIYLNDKSIGATDANFQLSKKLAPGEYRLMAKNKRQVVIPTKKISIGPQQTTFRLFEEVTPKPAPVAETPAEEEPKSDLDKMILISARVKKILELYADPATTDTVTPDDWQLVFQAAQLGQLQDYTAVAIEAQRWFASGQLELIKGEYVNAYTAFNKSLEYMPSSGLPFYGLGNTYFANNKYADAVKLYQRALQMDPQMAMAYKRLGDAQRLLEKEKEAIASYKSAIRFGYKSLETRFWLGTLLLNTKQIEEGLTILEEVAKEMPKAEVYISIGNGYVKLKRGVSAIEAYLKATEADPKSAQAFYKLADVYLNQREYPKAKEAYEKALSLDPDGKVINRNDAQKKLRESTGKPR